MIIKDLKTDFHRGWVVGHFSKSIIPGCLGGEMSIQSYKAGDIEAAHVHDRAYEVTVILEGLFNMGDHILQPDDVFCLTPGEAMSGDFKCVVAGRTAVFKTPSVADDKRVIS